MKMSSSIIRPLGFIGMTAALFLGCQDLLSSKSDSGSGNTGLTSDATALRLSIKDDSTCQSQYQSILAARSAGHADSASEASFLKSCVTDVTPPTGKPLPIVPPALTPDSGTTCKWIVAQIKEGRDEMNVKYQRYCPDDCRKLDTADTAEHKKFCGEGPGQPPKGHGDDTVVIPAKPGMPGHGDDTLPPKPGKPGPGDTLPKPPTGHDDDTCDMLHAKLDSVKPGMPGRADLEKLFALRCKEPLPIPGKPPVDTLPIPGKPGPGDTLPKPPGDDDTCAMLAKELLILKPGDPARAVYEKDFTLRCHEPMPKPPIDTVVVPPKDTDAVKPPIPPVTPPDADCDALRAKLALVDSASADAIQLEAMLKEHCLAH